MGADVSGSFRPREDVLVAAAHREHVTAEEGDDLGGCP
jgi:hypothetical protein